MRILLAVALVVGLTAGLSPSASAHLDTETLASVAGVVSWPADGSTCETQGSTNGTALGQNTWPGMLGSAVGPNPAPGGLPLGAHTDLCFEFTTLTINSAGIFEGQGDLQIPGGEDPDAMDSPHQTDFDCTSKGVTGASTGSATEVTGAFDGDFSCDNVGGENPLPAIVAPMGHFHGLSASGTIKFMGAIGPVNVIPGVAPPGSVLLHTLECEGQVRFGPDELQDKDPTDDIPFDSISGASVALECVIS